MSAPESTEPFPALSPVPTAANEQPNAQPGDAGQEYVARSRRSSTASSIGRRSRQASLYARRASASIGSAFMTSNPPLGMWQATGEVASQIPTLPDIKSGSFGQDGWNHEGQMERRGTNPHEIHRKRLARTSSATTRTRRGSSRVTGTPGTIAEEVQYFPVMESQENRKETKRVPTTIKEGQAAEDGQLGVEGEIPKPYDTTDNVPSSDREKWVVGPDETGTYPNGYRFPKKHTWTQATVIGLKAFWRFTLTPFGFLITLYGLNVVAWGAMIFFVLLDAAPAMCHPSCNDINSARKKWIEYDSQILNGLFCVTGFGLIPWRFRDFYFLMRWRLRGEKLYFRKLAGVHRGWFRLPGSDHLADDIGPPPVYNKKNPMTEESPPPYPEEEIAAMEANPAIPIPVTSMPPAPLTGVRAKPTKPYKIDIVVWMYLWNTILQGALAGCMWGFNRYNRPSATTGVFITFGCVVAIIAGIVVFIEGKKIKAVEGISVHEYDVFETVEEQMENQEKEAKKHKKDKKDKKANKDKNHTDTVEVKDASTETGEPNDGLRPTLTRTHTWTEKVKGKHWYERH